MPGFALTLAISAAAALRVASLDLCADEYLLLLARPGEIASVSRIGRDREDSLLWKRARQYPANDGTIESVLAARPTVLLRTGSGGGRSTDALARRLGVRVEALPYPATVADIEAQMVRVARLLGDARRADPWRVQLRQLERQPPPSRDTIFLSGGGFSVAAGSLSAEWMRLAGFAQRPLAEGRVTLEQLATRPPAVLLQSTYRAGQASLGQRWLDHPIVRGGLSQRIATDGRPWTCAGPMMLFEIERLRRTR
jgi:iron complex transport system substrate-binding protein